MNIFFTAAIRGGREHQRNYQTIVSLLKTHGTVFSDHVANDMPRHGETAISVEEVHARELERMEKSDVIVADVTTPSLGVGYLVGQASRLGKKILCLHYGDDDYRVSGMISGNTNLTLRMYHDDASLAAVLEEYFITK